MNAVALHSCVCLGAAGYQLLASTTCTLFFSEREVSVQTPRHTCFEIPIFELCQLQITGPGSVTAGGGFIGGGFGFEGAFEGMALAGILNAVTTKTKIHTFISLTTNVGEMHFHYSSMEPAALRIALADTFTSMRRQDPYWRDQRLAVLKSALQRKEIDDERFASLVQRLEQPHQIQPLPLPAPKAAAHLGALEGYAHIRAQQSKKQCPSCDSVLVATVQVCPHCSADFGPSASWTPVEIVRHIPASRAVASLGRSGYAVQEISGGWRIHRQNTEDVVAYALTEDDLAALSQLGANEKPLALWFVDLLSETERADLVRPLTRKRPA